MDYLVLLAELNRQVSAMPNSRQCHGDCRISNFLDERTEECLHDKGMRRRKVCLGDVTRQVLGGKY
jgi:hypothetical protein